MCHVQRADITSPLNFKGQIEVRLVIENDSRALTCILCAPSLPRLGLCIALAIVVRGVGEMWGVKGKVCMVRVEGEM